MDDGAQLRVLFVNCGDPDEVIVREFGGFAAWFARGFGPSVRLQVHDAREGPCDALQLDSFDALVVSGSPHSAFEELPWIAPLERLLRRTVEEETIPVLGVCFGHQVLAQACGGKVVRNPRGREMGTICVEKAPHAQEDELLGPLGEMFHMQATHRDTVAEAPAGAVVFGRSSLDECQSFRLGQAWGVQFHPEVTAPLMRMYLRARDALLRAEGYDPDELHAAVRDTPEGPALLARFAGVARRARARRR